MKKLLTIMFGLLFLLPVQARADCATVSSSLEIDIPCAEFSGTKFNLLLDLYSNTLDPGGLYFKFRYISPSSATSSCASIETNLNINITCATFMGLQYTLSLQSYSNPMDTQWLYWKLVGADDVEDGQNSKPVADSISLSVDSTIPYIEQQLSGHDPDNDTISYELISPATGTGYSSAYINSNGKLYITNAPEGNTSFAIYFRVSDGKLFSDPASVTVQVSYLADEDKETGRNDVPAEEYSQFSLSTFNSDLFGTVGEEPTTPSSVDLSANFPTPGDQGNQGSCVGWATAYALKSYQEKVEIGWALNTQEHLFSPAFVYNQINGGQDQGSYINEALDLAVSRGIATLATMPYSDTDYLTQPSSAAFTEASKFKAASWRRVNDTSQIKAALANRKPVVGGIDVYQQLMDLSGSNSVYNTSSGNSKGGHAITIVGYDDDKYGGAFKVINSWSQNWGDEGFFWMPYSFAAGGILSEAYVLEDAENTEGVITDDEDTEPEPDYSTLPNLTVEDWSANYDPRPRGSGSLTYTVKNSGAGVALAGADVNLMISDNTDISSSDYYVIYETIPFDLNSGESVYRDSGNAISFNFPDDLTSGIYYMALWVDDLDVMEESNEEDNISIGDDSLTIENTLPDLEVTTWYASWDSYGYGTLTYEVSNNGASSTTTTDWYVNLILDSDQVVGNGNEFYLFYEQAGFILPAGYYLYRNEYENPAYFNLYQTYDGYSVPSGVYYMALWVDDLDAEAESNELNNGSYSWGTINLSGYYGSVRSARQSSGAETTISGTSDQDEDSDGSGAAYNGKRLPPANLVWKKVAITRMDSGGVSMTLLDKGVSAMADEKEVSEYSKRVSARAKVIFPTTSSTPMP